MKRGREKRMKGWIVALMGVAVAVVAGCAGSRPCMIIPMQLELAETERNQVREQVTNKETEIKRYQDGVDKAVARVEQLRQERDELQGLLEQQAADSVAAAGRKK